MKHTSLGCEDIVKQRELSRRVQGYLALSGFTTFTIDSRGNIIRINAENFQRLTVST